MDTLKVCRVVEDIMKDFSDQIDCMGLWKSVVDGKFVDVAKKGAVATQLKLYTIFLISLVSSIGLWDTNILGSTISAFIGLIILLILDLVYEHP